MTFHSIMLNSLLVALTLAGLHHPSHESKDPPYFWSPSPDSRFATYLVPHGRATYDLMLFSPFERRSDIILAYLTPDGKSDREIVIEEDVPTPATISGAYSLELEIRWRPDSKGFLFRWRNRLNQEALGYLQISPFQKRIITIPPLRKWIKHPDDHVYFDSIRSYAVGKRG